MKPVYMINGFLESGKTEFIKYTVSQNYFRIKGDTLLILCEEGEIEYEQTLLKQNHTVIELIEKEEEFTVQHLLDLEKKYKPERIIIEFNGMWNFKSVRLPFHWKIEQQITIIDASTFPMYFSNMKTFLAEMLRKSEMIIFNRCDGIEDLANYKRNVKAINQQAEIIFEDTSGEIDIRTEEDLPYDINLEHIELDEISYGIWFLDTLDYLDRYVGKTVRFLATVMKPKEFGEHYFIPGRKAMTCCADDIAFLGFACKYGEAIDLKEKSWVMVTAMIKKEYFEGYKGEGPVLYAVGVEAAKAPKNEILSFV